MDRVVWTVEDGNVNLHQTTHESRASAIWYFQTKPRSQGLSFGLGVGGLVPIGEGSHKVEHL